MAGMNQNELFSMGLGLAAPWKVVKSELREKEGGDKTLILEIDFEPGARFACPECGEMCPAHDTVWRRWRHLDFWQHATRLGARVPRVRCGEHGVRQAAVPWAREKSGFTLMFEAFVMMLAGEMPVAAAARMVGEHDTKLWRVVRHHVDGAHKRQDWSGVDTVAVDETATRKGHRYATVVVDLDREGERGARLLFMTPERTAACVGEFAAEMEAHGAAPEQIGLAAIDMSPAYKRGIAEHLPLAEVVHDRFHVAQMAGKAVDEVRKQMVREGAEMKGALWALRGNVENLREDQRALREDLCARYERIGRALGLREALQKVWECPDRASGEKELSAWRAWACRSRLEPFRKLARTIKENWEGILAYFPDRVTSAAIEAVNGLIQTARRRARGYRNFENLRAICYWMAGRLDLKVPQMFAHIK